jgi:hypothetical protein
VDELAAFLFHNHADVEIAARAKDARKVWVASLVCGFAKEMLVANALSAHVCVCRKQAVLQLLRRTRRAVPILDCSA